MRIHVTPDEITDLDPRNHLKLTAQTGAIVSFTGLVREFGGAKADFELEHYPGMTEKQLEKIALEAMEKFDLIDVAITHRVGVMGINDVIVFMAASSPHRQAAFDGANYMMDYLKTRAPFWKKEGGETWVEARDADETALEKWDL